MSEYTAEDFAQATFARHGDGGRAARFAGDKWPWRASTADAIPWLSDEEMARDGWVPVVEARIMEHTLRDLRHDLAVARDERDRLAQALRRSLGQPKGDSAITLDGLSAAWEGAEQAGECRKGDVLIVPGGWGGYTIWAAERGCRLRAARILSRAPKREPWQDLADLLGHDVSAKQAEQMARRLHMVGVRVTGGGDDE